MILPIKYATLMPERIAIAYDRTPDHLAPWIR
jgi:hypothetical protein